MKLAQLRRYDVQARVGLILAALSVAPMIAAVAIMARNYRHEIGQIVYGSEGLFVILFVGCVLLSLAPGVIAFGLGWSSAGQRRNDRSASSWLSFFLGGAVATLDLILLLAFWMLRLQQNT